MISAFIKGVRQLGDEQTRKPLWISAALAAAVLAGLWAAVLALLDHTTLFAWGFLESAVDLLGGLAAAVLTFILFPGAVSAMVSVFLDQVAETVESRHYPELPPAPGQPMKEAVLGGLKFLGVMVALNILLLPFIFTAVLYPILFYAVNGHLIGREYFELVAARRLSADDARRLRKDHKVGVFMAGVLTAFSLTIPVVNLLTPVVATAAMLHLFEDWRKKGGFPQTRTPGANLTGAGPDRR